MSGPQPADPPPPAGSQRSLRSRAVRGAGWSGIERIGARLLSAALFAVLARLLDPSDFGLIALAYVLTEVLDLLVTFGLSAALVQREELEDGHLHATFWFGLATGLSLAAILFAFADPVAVALGDARLAWPLRVLSINTVLSGTATTPQAVLLREMRFGALAGRTLTASLAGAIAAIAVALLGGGVWALVVQGVVTAVIRTALMWSMAGYRPRLEVEKRHFRDLAGFGAAISGQQTLSIVDSRLDDFLIGRFLGTTALGYYSVGYRLLIVLTDVFVVSANRVLFPVFSKLQAQPERLERAYRQTVRLTSALGIPAFVGVALVADELVRSVFGDRWLPAVPVVQALAALGVLRAVMLPSIPLLVAMGKHRAVLMVSLVGTVLNVVAFSVAVRFGIVAVAIAYAARAYVMAPAIFVVTRRLAGIRLRPLLGPLSAVIGSAMAMAAAVLGIRSVLDAAAPLARGAAAVAVGSIVYYGTLRLLDNTTLTLLREQLASFVPRRLRRTAGSR